MLAFRLQFHLCKDPMKCTIYISVEELLIPIQF
jgi:hypothetical protein